MTSPNFNDVTEIGYETSSATSRARRESLVAFCFYPLEEEIVNESCFPSILKVQTVFTPISRLDKHAELLKKYFKPRVKKLKFSTLVAKFDIRFKVH